MRIFSRTPHLVTSNSFFTPFRVNLILLVSIFSLALVYFFSINTMATQGFAIKQLSTQLNELEAQHKKLELEHSKLQSVSTLEQISTQLNFVPSTNITYIKDDSFALK
jgi:cell division protein FtsL